MADTVRRPPANELGLCNVALGHRMPAGEPDDQQRAHERAYAGICIIIIIIDVGACG
jgi:hypothetical protein